jgi:hypothetical protein
MFVLRESALLDIGPELLERGDALLHIPKHSTGALDGLGRLDGGGGS